MVSLPHRKIFYHFKFFIFLYFSDFQHVGYVVLVFSFRLFRWIVVVACCACLCLCYVFWDFCNTGTCMVYVCFVKSILWAFLGDFTDFRVYGGIVYRLRGR